MAPPGLLFRRLTGRPAYFVRGLRLTPPLLLLATVMHSGKNSRKPRTDPLDILRIICNGQHGNDTTN